MGRRRQLAGGAEFCGDGAHDQRNNGQNIACRRASIFTLATLGVLMVFRAKLTRTVTVHPDIPSIETSAPGSTAECTHAQSVRPFRPPRRRSDPHDRRRSSRLRAILRGGWHPRARHGWSLRRGRRRCHGDLVGIRPAWLEGRSSMRWSNMGRCVNPRTPCLRARCGMARQGSRWQCLRWA